MSQQALLGLNSHQPAKAKMLVSPDDEATHSLTIVNERKIQDKTIRGDQRRHAGRTEAELECAET